MTRKGINREVILAKAIEIIEETGDPDISMRELADGLDIKTPSLYNHVRSMNEIFADISRYAAGVLRAAQLDAIEGKSGDDAVFALASAYRDFAKKHMGLYKVTIFLPNLDGKILAQTAETIAEPIFLALSRYELGGEQTIHWQRVLRSIIHGFLSQEEAGFFCHDPADVEISYHMAIRCFLDGLRAAAGEER